MTPPPVVVTGASGFIGSALCALLERGGHHPLKAGPRGSVLPNCPGAVCLHLAGGNDPGDVGLRYEKNLEEARALALHLLDAGYSRIVFASSALVYGDAETGPRAEESPLHPGSAYGRLKKEIEGLFLEKGHSVARLSNVYGPGMSPNNVFSQVSEQLQAGNRVKVRNLTSVRDYLYVVDAAQALAALAFSPAAGAFNVSTGRGTSVGEIVALLARFHERDSFSVAASDELTRTSSIVLDPAKMASSLGWKARVSLEEGLRALMEQPA